MRMIFVANTVYAALKTELSNVGTVIEIPCVNALYDGIRNHADLHVHIIDDQLFISKEIEPLIKDQLTRNHLSYHVIDEFLGTKYPETVYMNGLSTKDHHIHHERFIAKKIMAHIEFTDKQSIPVKQGYVRCTTLPLSNPDALGSAQAIITSDPGIYHQCSANKLDATLIRPGFIELEGHDYGFIGGTAGVIGHTVYYNGDITKHPDYDLIKIKCDQLQLDSFYIEGKPLNDIGSILSIDA